MPEGVCASAGRRRRTGRAPRGGEHQGRATRLQDPKHRRRLRRSAQVAQKAPTDHRREIAVTECAGNPVDTFFVRRPPGSPRPEKRTGGSRRGPRSMSGTASGQGHPPRRAAIQANRGRAAALTATPKKRSATSRRQRHAFHASAHTCASACVAACSEIRCPTDCRPTAPGSFAPA
jgi:hypothetical protein